MPVMRFLLVLAWVFFAQSASTEWIFIGGSDRADYYIEVTSVRRDGDARQMLELLDLKAPDNQGNKSYMAL